MSTKIYNGYKINNLSAIELNKFISELRDRLYNIYLDKYDKLFSILLSNHVHYLNRLDDDFAKTKDASKIEKFLNQLYKEYYLSNTNVIDTYTSDKQNDIDTVINELSLSYFGSLGSLIKDYISNKCQKIDISNIEDTSFDFISQLCLFPKDDFTLFLAYGDDLDDLLYTICKSRKNKDKAFRNKFGLEYYGYWNNTDKPKNISIKEWSKRCFDWKVIKGIPSLSGISIEILPYKAFFNKVFRLNKDIISGKYFIKKEDNAFEIAKSKIKDSYIKERITDTNVSSIIKLSEEFNELLNNDVKIKEEFNKEYKYLESILMDIDREKILTVVTDLLPNYMANR